MNRGARLPFWLPVSTVLFLIAVGWMVVSSLLRDAPPGYSLSPLAPQPEPDTLVERRITVDSRDPKHWIRLDLSRATTVPADDPQSWDIAVRRFRLAVNGGVGFRGQVGILALADTAYAEVVEAPAAGYAFSEVSRGGDTATAVLRSWYAYGFFSHLLEPRDITYVLRSTEGKYAKLRILGYYCPGAEPGCLTLEYSLQGDGSRRLTR